MFTQIIKLLLALLFVLINVLYLKKIEEHTLEIEFEDKKKAKILKYVHFLNGFYTFIAFGILAAFMLMTFY